MRHADNGAVLITESTLPAAGSQSRRPLIAVFMAGLALIGGALFYLVARPPDSTLLSLPGQALTQSWRPGDALSVLNALPSFLHVFAFALLTAVAVGLDRRCAWGAPFVWLIIDAAFELLQLPVPRAMGRALLDASPAPWLADLLLSGRGTFDPLDLAGLVLGAATAALIIAQLRRLPHGESDYANS